MHADGDWQTVEGVLSKDVAAECEYHRAWKLKLSTTKTVSAAFHLNSMEAKRGLKVSFNNETLPFCSEPGAEPDIFILGGHWRGQFCNKGSCQWSV